VASQLTQSTFTFASSLTGLYLAGWEWSSSYSGSAKSNASISSGTNPNNYRHALLYHQGWVAPVIEADIPIVATAMNVGVCTALMSTTNPGGYYGIYAGIFDGPGGSTYKVARMWIEDYRATDVNGTFRLSESLVQPSGSVHARACEVRLEKTTGSVTLGMVVAANGSVHMLLDGVAVATQYWAGNNQSVPDTAWRNSAATVSYSGIWAGLADQYVSELRVKFANPIARGHPTSQTTMLQAVFTGTNYTYWNPDSGNSVNQQSPLSAIGEIPGIQYYGNRAALLSAWPGDYVVGEDMDRLMPIYTGRYYQYTWQHYSGAYVFSTNWSGPYYISRIRVNSNESGSTRSLEIGGSDLKGDSVANTIFGTTYGTGMASGTWVRVIYYPTYASGQGGVAPIAANMTCLVQESTTGQDGPWTTRITSTDGNTGGSALVNYWPVSARFGYAAPSTSSYGSAVIDSFRVVWGPMTQASPGPEQTGFQAFAFPWGGSGAQPHDLGQTRTQAFDYQGTSKLTDKVTD